MSDTKPMYYEAKLTAEEILLLDGRCRPEVQALVERARATTSLTCETGLPEKIADMLVKIVAEAEKNGKLVYTCQSIRHCPCCGRHEGYHIYRGRSKYKRYGQPDYDKPILFTGWEVADRFISIQHCLSMGFCDGCATKILPVLRERLKRVKSQIPEALLGEKCRWKFNKNRRCTKCCWEGHEGEMGKERTLMGDGYYPAYCPNCKAGGGLFNRDIDTREGFTITELAV